MDAKTSPRDVESAEESESFSGATDADSKRERFRRLAESRTNKALSAIAVIGNLANRSAYEFEEAEVRKVMKALRDQISAVEERFHSPKTRASARFKL